MEQKLNHDLIMYYIDHPENLAERGYTTLPSDPCQVIAVVKGKSGYYPFCKYESKVRANNAIKKLNDIWACTPEEVEALMLMSMRKENG